ncbi:hypothetical protein H257_14730 [Aphanomyces astaci]|uniref:DDE-1 domain-containing protein n=1 Tax=Aphanomyces astaci TaxID=112090 RepID=W4FRM3_APHAT|nr:hypothetical protein H257_14730 [Aphanomyces astaci]ETV69591.1 hypothetical protein H257_14730 [Aphanomyces astaci]|eukprot:XP_009840918.1 hypothetical protein H257_14730 [Aphanomyces astaci]
MSPGRIWAEIGKSSKVDKSQKHSDQITAVLSVIVVDNIDAHVSKESSDTIARDLFSVLEPLRRS